MLPEILDGWHPPGASRLEPSSGEKDTSRTTLTGVRKLRLGPRRGEGAPHLGSVCPPSSWLPELLGRGRSKTRPNRSRAFVEYPKTGTACHAEPAPYRAARSLSSVDRESTHPWAGANPVWPEHGECSRHTAISVYSALPSPQHDWTSEPKQETTSARLCQGRI